jgi:GxxExxY protein
MASDTNRPPINDPQTFDIIGAAFEVHRVLGCGFSEPVYREGFTNELRRRNLPFAREVALPVYYKGDLLPLHYRADFVCYDDIIVELKALPAKTRLRDASDVSLPGSRFVQQACRPPAAADATRHPHHPLIADCF